MSAGREGPLLRLLQVNPTPDWRGGESQTLLLCEGLAARGHEVLLAADPRGPLLARARTAGLPTAGLRVRGDADPLGILRLARIAARFRPDLVHLHTSRAHGAGWFASFLQPRTPLVVSRRVDFAPGARPLGSLKYRTRVDLFVAVSGRVAQVLVEAGVPAHRVRTVYSGVPARAVPRADRLGALRAELGLPAGAPLVGTVGALAAHKDPLTLVRAFARLRDREPEARLLVVGDGPLRPEVGREVARLAAGDRVVLAGLRPDPVECLALLDVFVASSYLEGLNTSVLDAMSLGRPIVATRAGGIPEIVRDGETGLLVAPRDPTALAAAVARLLEDRALASRLGAAARTLSAEFTAERMVRETEAAYRDVIAARGATAARRSSRVGVPA